MHFILARFGELLLKKKKEKKKKKMEEEMKMKNFIWIKEVGGGALSTASGPD